MKTDVEALRKKYMDNPPEGLTSTDIRHMSEEDLLDMDYFLNDETLLDQSGGLILLIDFYVLKQYGTEHPITVQKLPHILINDPFFIPLLMYKK